MGRSYGASPLLHSLSGTVWEPLQPVVAGCEIHREPPATSCNCGVVAFREIRGVVQEFKSQGVQGVVGVLIQTDLWGRVVEGESAFRAQFAYPRALTVWRTPFPRDLSLVLEGLALYQVPVQIEDDPRLDMTQLPEVLAPEG